MGDDKEPSASPASQREADSASPPPMRPSIETRDSSKSTYVSHPSTSAETSAHAAIDHQLSKRRRGLGVVTPNACTECRKKRAKCDGQRPCGRCKVQKDIHCVYEVPVRQSKEHLRSELDGLRQRQRSSDDVLAALVRPELWEETLTRLRGGQSVENITEWLGSGAGSSRGTMGRPELPERPSNLSPISATTMTPTSDFPGSSGSGNLSRPGQTPGGTSGGTPRHLQAPPQGGLRSEIDTNSPWGMQSHSHPGSTSSGSHPDAMNWTPDPRGSQSRGGHWSEDPRSHRDTADLPRHGDFAQVLSFNAHETEVSPGHWTSVTGDVNLIQHLLALYFCWEYPTFASLSKEHFLQDFRHGRPRYCSSMLVNAILALGCRFSSQPMTRADPNDPYTSGNHFFKESQRLFQQELDHHNLSTIQALGIMSIREASCGRDSESWYYAGQSVRLAVEMGLHRVHADADEDELAVRSATFWGAFALDHAWSLATGSLPQCSHSPHVPPKPAIIDDVEASLWVPYTDDGAPLQRSCEQPSNVRSVYKCFCELSELVHQSLYILHLPGRPLNARDLLKIYTQYLNWYDRIPESLRLGHNFTPAVLFAHMYYHYAILLLFRPLIKLRIVGSKVSPRDVCLQAADAMQGLLMSYSQLYTLRRTPSFVPYFLLTSVIMHLTVGSSTGTGSQAGSASKPTGEAGDLDPHVADAIKQGISDLAEMAPCHQFAEQALHILRFLAKKWNIEVDVDNGRTPPKDQDDLVGLVSASLNFFAPNVQQRDYECKWGTARTEGAQLAEDGAEKGAEVAENPLFWPFPMQGRPILPSGPELETAGFAFL